MNDVVDRQTMDVDIVCVGFGPATAGFLSTLEKTPNLESAACPGMPLQVICYERADDVGFGVSGVAIPSSSETVTNLKPLASS